MIVFDISRMWVVVAVSIGVVVLLSNRFQFVDKSIGFQHLEADFPVRTIFHAV